MHYYKIKYVYLYDFSLKTCKVLKDVSFQQHNK
jgi:hypothetical protein